MSIGGEESNTYTYSLANEMWLVNWMCTSKYSFYANLSSRLAGRNVHEFETELLQEKNKSQMAMPASTFLTPEPVKHKLMLFCIFVPISDSNSNLRFH